MARRPSKAGACRVFVSYSHKDRRYLEELERYLADPIRHAEIDFKYDASIGPGKRFKPEIFEWIDSAHIVLLFASQNFLASEYCQEEMERAITRLEKGSLPTVIRITIKRVPAQILDGYTALPRDGEIGRLGNSRAWIEVAEGVIHVCADLCDDGECQQTEALDRFATFAAATDDIPLPVAAPVGRDAEVDSVCSSFRRRASVVLTGPSGIGKSTVLAAALRKLANQKRHPYSGLFFHRLAETDSATARLRQLLVKLITCLRPSIEPDDTEDDLFAQARRLLRGRNMLIVVDNVDDEKSQRAVDSLWANLPGTTIGVTSRLPRGWDVLRRQRIGGLSAADGYKLFQRTCKGQLPRKAVEDLCAQFHGHPMLIRHAAIEAQSGVHLPDIEVIGPDLAERFDRMRERTPEDRHGVFALVGLLEAASIRADLVVDVLSATTRSEVSLRDLQSLDFQIPDLIVRRARLTAHQALREWCRRQRWDDTEIIRVTARFYLKFLKQRRAGEPAMLLEIDEEWPSILGLLDKLTTPGRSCDPDMALEIVREATGDHYDDLTGYIPKRKQIASLLDEFTLLDEPERRTRADVLLELSKQAGTLTAAHVEKNLGHFYYWRGDFDKAEELFQRACDRFRQLGSREGEVFATWLMGYLADDRNYYAEAERLYREATHLAIGMPDQNLLGVGHHLIGCTLYHQGRFEEAETEFHLAQRLSSDVHLRSRADRRLASVAIELGRLDEAAARLEHLETEVERLGRPRDVARIQRRIGLLALRRGRLAEAESRLSGALEQFRELRFVRSVGATSLDMAVLRSAHRRFADAETLAVEALAIARQTSSLFGEARALEELATILEQRRRLLPVARRYRQRARNIYTVIGHTRAMGLPAARLPLPKRVRGVLFDLMDTLAILEPGKYDQQQDACAARLGISTDLFRWAWRTSRDLAQIGALESTAARFQFVVRKLGMAISDADLEAVTDSAEEMWRQVTVEPLALPLLTTLRQRRIRTGILCNGPAAMTGLRESLGLSSMVDCAIFSCEVHVAKPEKRIYELALSKLRLNASEVVFVGDGNDRELDGARDAGLFTVKIKRPRAPYAEIKSVSLDWDLEVEGLQELQNELVRAC